MTPERPTPNPFAWQDHNDERYDRQQEEIDKLKQQVQLLMHTMTLLLHCENDKRKHSGK